MAQGGFVGVDLFFVLSGFLITSILRSQREVGEIDYWGFMANRMVRLYPGLLFMLAGVLAFSSLWPTHRWEALTAAAYLSNISLAVQTGPTPLAHMWSLAAEAQFYTLWPLLLPLLRRPVPMLVAAYVAFTLLRCVTGWVVGYHLHCTGIILGGLMTYVQRPPGAVAWPALAVILTSTWLLPYPNTAG